ncbi:hypothetical protein HanIR_Chr03g0121011 [Helianthus annuus]|nr:hypothetical protein HanIR_Chr03g0121011 [Helianthus annuus]
MASAAVDPWWLRWRLWRVNEGWRCCLYVERERETMEESGRKVEIVIDNGRLFVVSIFS